MADFLHLQRKILGGERFNRWLAGTSTSSGCKCERKPSDLDMSAHSRSFSVPMWILYSQGRLWFHHQSCAEDHHRFSFLQWLTQFFCLFVYANKWQEKNHHRNGDQWWQPLPSSILAVATTTDCHSSGGPELKLRWWTQTGNEICPYHLGVQ